MTGHTGSGHAGGQVVIAAYRPKTGQDAPLLALLARHVPTLRRLGLASDRPATLVRSFVDGTYLETFEWRDATAAEKAHHAPEVAHLWDEMGKVADFRALSELEEMRRPFPHFAPVDGVTS